VAELLDVPLPLLLDPATRREEDWTWRGAPLHVPFYALGEHKVWGATAIVLAEFLALLARGSGALKRPAGSKHQHRRCNGSSVVQHARSHCTILMKECIPLPRQNGRK